MVLRRRLQLSKYLEGFQGKQLSKKPTRNICLGIAFFLALAFTTHLVSAAANLQVTSFSCSQADVVINSLFSCSATIQNN